eukprot:TRINITY_DN12217_c0_g1_i1.p1 TRINITY_DN12217_c0_g1~~TRINITY_DN12217_c0_g1_i1.p1  ORF type:complete len:403 (+),score=18.26 TRINITY_DN12217_c0_g1_i1:159-1367(+)
MLSNDRKIWSLNSSLVQLNVFKLFQQQGTTNCEIDTATLILSESEEDQFRGSLEVRSNNCSLNFIARLASDNSSYSVDQNVLTIILSFIAMINYVTTFRMIKLLKGSDRYANRITPFSFGVSTMCNVSILFFIPFLLDHPNFTRKIFGVINLILFIVIAWIDYMVFVLRLLSRLIQFFGSECCAIFAFLFLKALIVFVLFTFMYFITYNITLLIGVLLVYVPQIAHSAIKGVAVKDRLYILGLYPPKLLLILYLRGWQNNIFEIEPFPEVCIASFVLIAFQIVVILRQSSRGARFFIPKRFFSQSYEFRFKLNDEIDFGSIKDIECPICLSLLGQDPWNIEMNELSQEKPKLNSSISDSTRLQEVKLMRTPCDHYFHEKCLQDWLHVQLDCPSCRATLPDFD